ncbi:peptidase, partial [Gardnerella vaginalis]
VSATDTSGNKAEKQVKIKLENLNKKYKEPTATPITVDWGHKLTENDLKPHVTGIEGGGQLVFNPFPKTDIPQEYFNGRETLPANASAKVVYSDNSYHVVTIPVNIKKPLSLQHKLNGNTVNTTVGEALKKINGTNKVDAKEYLGITDKKVKDKIKSAEWVNGEPSTAVAGKREYTAKVTFSDGSTAEEKVTFTVRPKKPTIETDLTGVAGVKGKEVVVDAGPGTAGSTVTLKDSKGNQIGTGKVGNDGKVTITVANGIPEGNITAVTTTADSVSSDASDAKKATKDDKAPTLTADKDSITVKVGEDLKIQLTAKDDVKIESIDTATATMAFARNDFNKMMTVAARAKTDYTTNTDKEKVFTYTFSGFKPEEVGTYTLTFSATDAAGHKTQKTVTVKVEKKEDLQPKNITVDLGHKLDEKDAKKAIANHRSLPKGTKFAWSKETNGTPDTSTVGKEKSGKVIVTIPTNDKNHPRVETVDVKVTVRDNESPKVAIQQKGDGGTYNTIDPGYPDGPKYPPVFTITTYRGDKNDIKITATDNSGDVTTLTLTPKTPGETEKAPTGTGTTADPKTLTLDGTTPLNTKPGEYTRTITAVDPSGNTNKVTVKFIVKPQSDKYSKVTGTPVTYNMSDGTKHPDPKSGIDPEAVKKLPKDAKYSWAKEPDWNKPGKDTTATVRITFPDGSTKDVETKVTVKDNIAPVIENPATNQVKHDDKQMYYQFKVHKDKPFDIEIKSYDNSGKISSATIETFPGHDGKITVDNQNGNSAEKPATIHIKGTGKRDAKITNSSDNKWSRDLIVKDEAGNTSKLKVQISVYTDAEEHNAAPNATPKNPDQNAITNAIIITKKDDPKKTPIDKKDLTFTVGNIPQDDGVHTVPVTITYPDHSTTIVNVPVLIHKDNKDYDPKGQTVEVPWNTKPEELTKKITSFDNGGGLTWNGTSGKDKLKSVEIVNTKDVPSTDKPGESQVQVKVTYKDGSSDVATVTVRVLKPQSETYKPEGQTINIDYNKTPNAGISSKITGVGKDKGISFGKDKQGKDITLPEGASIAIDDKAKTVPDGTQPGTFDIPVTITYKDGSKDHATVKVTVGKPQSETHTPKVDGGITKKYGESGPSDNDIIAKVTVPNKPNGTTITVDKGQTPIDTKTPGTVNVKVTVKYPDGSEDHVEVP